MADALLTIRDLAVNYRGVDGSMVSVIDGLDLTVQAGETVAIVGESGSGKSTLAAAISGLVRPSRGTIRFGGSELLTMSRRERRATKRDLQLVFQNAHTALSPRRRIGWQLHEPLRVHTELDGAGRHARILEVIRELELADDMLDRYPHELSGGQAQRVVLARAMLLDPSFIIFDEPTSALDVSVQAGVLNALRELKRTRGLTYLFITHDLAVARFISDRIAVLRQGEIVELGVTAEVFDNPQHDYTKGLLGASLSLR